MKTRALRVLRRALGAAGLLLCLGLAGVWAVYRPNSLHEAFLVLQFLLDDEDYPGETTPATRRLLQGALTREDIRSAVFVPMQPNCSATSAWAPQYNGMPRTRLTRAQQADWAERLQRARRMPYRIDPVQTRTPDGWTMGGVTVPAAATEWRAQFERWERYARDQGRCGELQFELAGGQTARLPLVWDQHHAGVLRHLTSRDWTIVMLDDAAPALLELQAAAQPTAPQALAPELSPQDAMHLARARFGAAYVDQAQQHLRASTRLAALIGPVQQVWPAAGPNRVGTWSGETFDLSFLVQGTQPGLAVVQVGGSFNRPEGWVLHESVWWQGRLH